MAERWVLIANLGHSDLQITGSIPELELSPGAFLKEKIAEVGRRLYEAEPAQIKEWRHRLDFPILRRYLEFAQGEGVQFQEIILFGSHQPEDPEFGRGDTYPLAQAIRRHKALLGFPDKVYTREVEGNPSDLVDMLGVYGDALEWIKEKYASQHDDPVRICIGLTGGTPQMNDALLIHSAEILAPAFQLEALYVPRNYGARRVSALYRIRRHLEYRSLRSLAETSEYSALANRLDDVSAGVGAAVYHLARYGQARLNSDWQRARRELEEAHRKLGPNQPQRFRGRVDRWMREVESLRDEESGVWLRELAWQADVVWQQGNLWAFLVRVASFRENGLEKIALDLGMKVSKTGRYLDPNWVRDTPGLEDYARQSGVDLTRELNHRIFDCVAEFLAMREGAERQRQVATLQALGGLVRLRNEAAHKGTAVTLEGCTEVFRKGVEEKPASREYFGSKEDLSLDDLLSGIVRLAAELSGVQHSSANPFKELNDTLVDLLDLWRKE